jgi:hypothetical protein
MVIKGLTISQPFASLIADGEKWVENRTWSTRYRGWLAIHAGKGTQYLTKSELAEYPTGCVIAVAMLVDCVSILKADPDEKIGNSSKTYGMLAEHKHAEGPYMWVLDRVKKLSQPVQCNGAQGLWSIDKPLLEKILSAMPTE